MERTSDYRGPARFVAGGAEFPVVVEVTGARGVWSSRPAPTGDLAAEVYEAETIRLIGGSLPATATNRTGELRCGDRQVFVGEFNADGEFLHLETV